MPKKPPPAPKAEPLGLVLMSDIQVDDAWNTRILPTDEAEDGEVSADEGLRASIAQAGILQPLGVSRRPHAQSAPHYRLVFGFRRFRAAEALKLKAVPCVLVADEHARFANLTENFARSNLAPYELMEAVGRMKDEQPDLTNEQISVAVGRHWSYVANLLRMRRKLCPELLEQFRDRGPHMHMRYLVQVCTLSHEAQQDRYNELVTGSKGGRPAGSRSGDTHARGSLAEPKHLRRWIKQLGEVQTDESVFMRAWVAGAKHAFECALGKKSFSLGVDRKPSAK